MANIDFTLRRYTAQCIQCGQHVICSAGVDETPNGSFVPDNLYYTIGEEEDIDNCPGCGVSLYRYPPQRIQQEGER